MSKRPTTTHFSLQELITDIGTSFDKLEKTISDYYGSKTDNILVGTYTFKDIIAHLAEWEKFCLDSLKQITNKTIIPHKLNIKQINFGFYQKNKDQNLEEITGRFYRNHQQLMSFLGVFEQKLLSHPDPYYPSKHTVYSLIEHCTNKHYDWARKYIKS